MIEVNVQNLSKSFGNFKAVDDISFSLDKGSLLTIVGPSGSGKTTILRCIAGVELPDSGNIEISGKTVFSSSDGIFVPPEERNIGMVYQSYALWPHMTVFDNVSYPLRIRGDTERLKDRVEEVLSLMRIRELSGRYPYQLSGGEQQRVALARALVYKPTLLLLDEPLTNLDAPLRESLRDELRQIQRRTGITTIYVTHDRMDALSISDFILVLSAGRIMGIGRPIDLVSNPPNSYIARFLNAMLIIQADVSRAEGGKLLLQTDIGTIEAYASEEKPSIKKVIVAVRPKDIKIVRGSADGIRAEVIGSIIRGPGMVEVRIELAGQMINVPWNDEVSKLPEAGEKVHIAIPPEACVIIQS